MIRAIATLALATSLAACALTERTPEVRNRFASATPRPLAVESSNQWAAAKTDEKPLRFTATISSTAVPSGGDKGTPVTSLSDRGQAAYVAALAGYSKDGASLGSAIAKPLKPAPRGDPRLVEKGQIERRFIIALTPENGMLAPGDRLSWASLRIEPINARFLSWTVAHNQHDSIDVGTIKATESDTLKAETGLKIGGPLVDTSVSAESSRTREETAAISDESSINALVTPQYAEVIQSGGWRRDLTGNATFDATLELDLKRTTYVYGITGLWEKGKPVKPEKAAVSYQMLMLPQDQVPICAKLQLDYVVRHIVSGQQSFTEADDIVELARGSFTSAPLQLAPVQRFARYGLSVAAGAIHIQRPGMVYDQLAFSDVEQALTLIDWLNALPTPPASVGRMALGVFDPATGKYRSLTRADLNGLTGEILEGAPAGAGALTKC